MSNPNFVRQFNFGKNKQKINHNNKSTPNTDGAMKSNRPRVNKGK